MLQSEKYIAAVGLFNVLSFSVAHIFHHVNLFYKFLLGHCYLFVSPFFYCFLLLYFNNRDMNALRIKLFHPEPTILINQKQLLKVRVSFLFYLLNWRVRLRNQPILKHMRTYRKYAMPFWKKKKNKALITSYSILNK